MRKTLAGGAMGDWPQFRGPDQDGISPEKRLLRSRAAFSNGFLWPREGGCTYGSCTCSRACPTG